MNFFTGRCNNCSLNSNTSEYGTYLGVYNCGEDDRCDVIINNRKTRYECRNVSNISDCVDRLTYCSNDLFDKPKQLREFCESPPHQSETHTKLGEGYIDDGSIIWNVQMHTNRCGSARTDILDHEGNPFSQDQSPNCLPYSNTTNNQDGCINGDNTMYQTVCNTPECEDLMGGNPCATNIDAPLSWKEDVCSFVCPPRDVQDFWFDGKNLCSEDYYRNCKRAGCEIDQKCKDQWGMDWVPQHPTVNLILK